MELSFVKMQGIGNDFVLIDDRSGAIGARHFYDALARKLCDRHFGIGADGLLIIRTPGQPDNGADTGADTGADIGFAIYNCDGSQAQMCGNGIRCVARYLYETGVVAQKRMRVETLAGLVVPEVIVDDAGIVTAVRVDMGSPVWEPSRIPVRHDGEKAVKKVIYVGQDTNPVAWELTCVSMGNPHAVIFVDDYSSVDVAAVGAAIEVHPDFPEKTNVEFVRVMDRTCLEMKVWERGAGITLACGTGACASLAAACVNGLSDTRARLCLDGGELEIFWDQENDHIFMTGPAEIVFTGKIYI